MKNTQPAGSGATRAEIPSSSGASLAGLKSGRQQYAVTWSDAEPDRLSAIVSQITEAGGLVSMSKTSDGGAICFYVRHQGLSEKFYAGSASELSDLLNLVQGWSASL